MRRLLSLFFALVAAARLGAADSADARGGVLQLIDGSMLHGSLDGIETNLSWSHPGARGLLAFRLTNLALIRFDHAEAPARSFKAAARFQFRNGDELIGNILELKDNTLRFQSWFGDSVQADIESLDSLSFSSKGYNLLYEGPSGLEGWKTGRNPRSWEYKDGAFIANGADLLGRDFGLTGSSTLEFDLAWNGAFSMSITLYAQIIDRFDYSTSAYLVYLGTGNVSVQRVQAGSGAIMLGQTMLPEMSRRNSMHFEIRCNKEDATISLFADGKFVQRWRDTNPGGFVAKGGGIVFFSQVEPRKLVLSNIRVAEWDGRFEPEAITNALPESDVLFLANKDRVAGKVLALDEAKATVETKQTKLDIPLSRITQIRFARNETASTNFEGREVRATFPGGESLVFDLQKWDTQEVAGTSKVFGPLTFNPKNIRHLQFNLMRQQAQPDAAVEADEEFLEAAE
jgi:hypothetical protein